MPLDPIGDGGLSERAAPVPFLPAARLSRRPRRLPGARGFFFNPSLDGGFELLELSRSNRRRSSATSASSAALSRRRVSFSRSSASNRSQIAAEKTIPAFIMLPSPCLGQSCAPEQMAPLQLCPAQGRTGVGCAATGWLGPPRPASRPPSCSQTWLCRPVAVAPIRLNSLLAVPKSRP